MATQTNALKDYVLAQERPTPFQARPRPYYSKLGDFLSFCWAPEDPFFTRRVDEFLTCYHSKRTGKVIGCKVKGIRYLIEKLKTDFRCRVGKPTIYSVTIVGRGVSKSPAKIENYEDVWENSKSVEIEDPELQFA